MKTLFVSVFVSLDEARINAIEPIRVLSALLDTLFGSDGHGSLSRCIILTAKKSYAAVIRGLIER
ncbi:MAG: hypothetical protein OHK0046_34370 [Anaerolineae bacterium]